MDKQVALEKTTANSIYHFFLGGSDLEIQTIRELLRTRKLVVFDRSLVWGAVASAYADQIQSTIAGGGEPVLVELLNDLLSSLADRCRWIDHFGDLAGENQPCSLQQVTELLGISQEEFRANRHWMLAAANDIGHIRGMRKLDPPATDSAIRAIRWADLKAQGVTESMFEETRRSLASCQSRASRRLTVAQIESNRTGLAAELLAPFFGGSGFKNLLVRGQDQFGFFGAGWLVDRLVALSPPAPESWSGGSLPESGFRGAVASPLEFDPESTLSDWLDSNK